MRRTDAVGYDVGVYRATRLMISTLSPRTAAVVVAMLGVTLVADGCGEPADPDLDDVTLVYPDALEPDVAPDGFECSTSADCPVINDCCVANDCIAGACSWYVLPDCCTTEGPCAVASPSRTGVCATTCVAGGCEQRLRLDDEACGETIATLIPSPVAPAVTIDARGTRSRLGWYRDMRVPFDGEPSWRLADARCDVLHNGALSAGCEPSGSEGEGFRAALTFAPVELPAARPLVLEAVVAGVPDNVVGDPTVPVVALQAVFSSGAVANLWSNLSASAGTNTSGAWTPIAADLGQYAGQTIALRLEVSSNAGPARRDRGIGLAAVQVRVPCASEREAPPATDCAVATPVVVQPTAEVLHRLFPRDPVNGCHACAGDDGCAPVAHCLRRTCEASVCTLDEARSTCCEGDAARPPWLGAIEGWTGVGVPWRVETTPDGSGTGAFHFPLAEEGGIPRGAITSPAFFVPPGEGVLSFEVWLETEWDDATSAPTSGAVDRFWITQGIGGAGDSADDVVVWDSASIGGSTRGRWQAIEAPLAGAVGSVATLTLHFDAGDPDFNAYGGVWLRALSVGADCRPR